jgi:hypothetical protein
MNLAPGSFPSPGARIPLAAPPAERPPFVHASLARCPDGFWFTSAPIACGTVLIREMPLAIGAALDDAAVEVASAAHGGAARACLWFGADVGDATKRVAAVLPRLSVVAHSSAPNATLSIPIRWAPRESTILTLLSLTALAAGERVTASRAELLQSPSKRAAQLAFMRVREQGGDVAAAAVAALDARLTAAPGLVSGDADARAAAVARLKSSFDDLSSAAAAAAAGGVRGAVDAWLAGPAAGLAPHHWRVLHARVLGTCGAISARDWPDAWARLAALTRGVAASGVPRAHADALRVTMELTGVVVRGWQADDPGAALDASAGSLLKPERRADNEWYIDTLNAGKAAQPFISGLQ